MQKAQHPCKLGGGGGEAQNTMVIWTLLPGSELTYLHTPSISTLFLPSIYDQNTITLSNMARQIQSHAAKIRTLNIYVAKMDFCVSHPFQKQKT